MSTLREFYWLQCIGVGTKHFEVPQHSIHYHSENYNLIEFFKRMVFQKGLRIHFRGKNTKRTKHCTHFHKIHLNFSPCRELINEEENEKSLLKIPRNLGIFIIQPFYFSKKKKNLHSNISPARTDLF